MKIIKAVVSDKTFIEQASEKFKIAQEYNATFDQVWFYYNKHPEQSVRVTLFLDKISAHFELKFDSYSVAVQFLFDLNISDFSGDSTELYHMLYYGNKEGRKK